MRRSLPLFERFWVLQTLGWAFTRAAFSSTSLRCRASATEVRHEAVFMVCAFVGSFVLSATRAHAETQCELRSSPISTAI
jgi:hypothetical protein